MNDIPKIWISGAPYFPTYHFLVLWSLAKIQISLNVSLESLLTYMAASSNRKRRLSTVSLISLRH